MQIMQLCKLSLEHCKLARHGRGAIFFIFSRYSLHNFHDYFSHAISRSNRIITFTFILWARENGCYFFFIQHIGIRYIFPDAFKVTKIKSGYFFFFTETELSELYFTRSLWTRRFLRNEFAFRKTSLHGKETACVLCYCVCLLVNSATKAKRKGISFWRVQ